MCFSLTLLGKEWKNMYSESVNKVQIFWDKFSYFTVGLVRIAGQEDSHQ